MNKILAFTASWCGPCKALKPTLEKLPEGSVISYDIDEYPDMRAQYEIRAVPTLVVLNSDGAEVKRMTGSQPLRVLEELLSV
jgi:thioredoxin 1